MCVVRWRVFDYTPACSIAGSEGKLLFILLWNLSFRSGSTSLHFQQQRLKDPLPLHSHIPLLSFVFLILAIMTKMKPQISINIFSLMANDFDHYF